MDTKELTKAVEVINKSAKDIRLLSAKAEIAKLIMQNPTSVQSGHNFPAAAGIVGVTSEEFQTIMQEIIAETSKLYSALKNAGHIK